MVRSFPVDRRGKLRASRRSLLHFPLAPFCATVGEGVTAGEGAAAVLVSSS